MRFRRQFMQTGLGDPGRRLGAPGKHSSQASRRVTHFPCATHRARSRRTRQRGTRLPAQEELVQAVRRPHPVPSDRRQESSIAQVIQPCTPLPRPRTASRTRSTYAMRAPEQQFARLLRHDGRSQNAVRPRLEQSPLARAGRPPGEDVFVALVHAPVPPLLDEGGHEADESAARFDAHRQAVLVQLELDHLELALPPARFGHAGVPRFAGL